MVVTETIPLDSRKALDISLGGLERAEDMVFVGLLWNGDGDDVDVDVDVEVGLDRVHVPQLSLALVWTCRLVRPAHCPRDATPPS